MKSLDRWNRKAARTSSRLRLAAGLIVCLGIWNGTVQAKEPGLTAIEIYNGPTGAAYVQLTNVLVSAKIEMRVSASAEAPMEHGAYNKLSKIALGVGGVLERGSDGVLRYTGTDGQTVVVVPWNAKFEHGASLSPAQLADQAVLRGTAVGTGGQPQQLDRGVKLVFVEAPDQEYAEFLRAERASDIPGWRDYLAKYSSSRHVGDAKDRLAALYAQAGESALAEYDKTAASSSPAYNQLKSARANAEQAIALAPGLDEVKKLDGGVQSALAAIVEKAGKELDAYQQALKDHTAGYGHLGTAKSLAETANGIEITKDGQATLDAVMKAYDAVQNAMRQAESSATAKRYDQALASVEPYRSFAGEEPRIATIIEGNYNYHLDAGKRAASASNWETAIAEFEKAEKAKNTPDEHKLLLNARAQWAIAQDRTAAQKAQAESASYEQEKDIIRAYETLDQLPDSQRKLVQDDLNRLQPAYIQRCSQLAKEVRQAHEPLRSLSDEEGIEEAYNYLAKAYKLGGDESFHDRMDLLGDELSGYLLDQAKQFLAKPDGSGTELGWTYLSEAFSYKASNLSAVRDAMTANAAAHAIRSKLSIRVQFRDQTSQREGGNYAGQLENAVIAGLQSGTVPVKVIRTGDPAPVVPADYVLDGNVLHHHLTEDPKVEEVQSKYLSGTRQVPSDEWNKANRDYETARMELASAQAALQGAEAKGNKHDVEDRNKSAQAAMKKVQDALAARDATPQTRTEDLTLPYTYTKRTVNLTSAIEMQFSLADSVGNDHPDLVPIKVENSKSYTILENVKPEDTSGIKDIGTAVDKVEFLTATENAAMDSLISAVRQRVGQLPHRIYEKARRREDEEDTNGAGEAYMRFLELQPDENTPEAKHARQFLHDQFNMSPASIVAAP